MGFARQKQPVIVGSPTGYARVRLSMPPLDRSDVRERELGGLDRCRHNLELSLMTDGS